MAIRFEFSVFDFHPQVNFKPRHCLVMTPAITYSTRPTFVSNYYSPMKEWLNANVGVQSEDWQITSSGRLDSEKYRFWFKDQLKATLFKLAFDGT